MSAADVLKKIMSKLHIDQNELAKGLNVTKTAIYNWEKGLRVPKDMQKLNIINFANANKIKVKIEEFY